MTDGIVAMLGWLKIEGDVLQAVRPGWTGADLNRRTQDEVHDCLRCGERAQAAYVAHTDKGDRWLDLCWRDAYAARWALDEAQHDHDLAYGIDPRAAL